jgi:threonine dehydratase
MALEITRELSRRGAAIDAILIPLGNGAMLAGIGVWMRAHAAACRVIGVVASAAPAMMTSWRAGRALPTATAATIADGIAVREPMPYALDCMKAAVDDVWEVGEDAIVQAMRFCRDHYGMLLEPSGAVGVAAAMARRADLAGARVAAILCGGNLTEEQRRLYLSD